MSNADPDTGFPTFSRVFPSDRHQARALINVIKYFNWTRISTFKLFDDPYSDGIQNAISKAIADDVDAGIKIVSSVSFSKDLANNTIDQDLRVIKDSGSKVIVLIGYADQAEAILRRAKLAGMTGEGWAWLGLDAWAVQAGDFPDNIGNGVVGITPEVDKTSQSWKALETCYAAHKDDTTGPFGNFSWLESAPNVWTAFIWDATQYGLEPSTICTKLRMTLRVSLKLYRAQLP